MKSCIIFLIPLSTACAMSVSLASSVQSPAPLGTPVTFTATANAADSGALQYRFRARYVPHQTGRRAFDPEFRTVVDYGPNSTLTWATIDREGAYEIEASVKNSATGENAATSVRFVLTRLATGATPVVTPSMHPMVSIYSAPPCPRGARMRVTFQSSGGVTQSTPARSCESDGTMNFYLAGMRASAAYTAFHTIETPNGSVQSATVNFTTPGVSMQPPAVVPLVTPPPSIDGVLLQSVIGSNSIATDLNGNLIWYAPSGLSLLTRVNPGGTFLGILEDGTRETTNQIFREFDLTGITLAETNASRVNEQLAALGAQPITSFHHEAIHLPDGRYLVLGGSERILTDVQGPGPVDVLGDTILMLDSNLQVLWWWDAFDHLDPHRMAVLDETCDYPASLACSVFYGAGSANDWLHGNALQFTPDGNILYSVRHQDWLIKIDYRNGLGTGDILWRMGVDGDFQITGDDPNLWFSHQHAAAFLSDNTTLMLFDNGNTRIAHNNDMGTSRGQILRVNEQGRTATLMLNADLKVNSSALGTAEVLPNGHYHFDAGFIPDPANPAARITQALELDPTGNIVWGMQIYAQEYRSFRMNDLYSPPTP